MTRAVAAVIRWDGAVTLAAAAGAAYYVGSWVGLQLRLPPATPSVVWPPNALLTGLLLVVAPARWWSVFLGAAGAHFLAQLPVWSPWFVFGLFLTNCSEALVAAVGVRWLSDRPYSFDTLRRAAIFLLIGGFVAPLVSTFLDAGVVSAIHGEEYWAVWKARLVSNVLAQLAIVPAVTGVIVGSRGVLTWPLRRWVEAAAITSGLTLVAFAVSLDAGQIGLQNSPLAPFLPLLLWAAVRFGPTGVALSVLGTVFVAVVSALHGDGLFPMISVEERIRTLQVFLISATVPLLCVGALVEERRKADAALRSSDMLKASILTSISSLVAVIDRDGRVLAVNENWRTASDKGVDAAEFSAEPGAPYLEVWAAAARHGSANARAGYDGIHSVLAGAASGFALEYRSDPSGADQWWMMSVVPLKRAQGGAVITHTDITPRKRAEREVQRRRDELAHAARVSVMGALTASLSHQLKQPLTGIIGNALAGRHFLDATPPNLVELRDILADIAADAQRASDVTCAIRDMLVKDTSADELLDVNDVVRDTTVLVTGEAASRNVAFVLQLAPSLPLVRGKRVQLRQVVLNLSMNALEALANHQSDPSTIVVRTEASEAGAVHISVTDTGCGLPRGAEEQVFEPLFTTKDAGMGMGLPIALAIVEAHGGTLSAYNGVSGGSTFSVTLPAASDQLPA